MKTWNLINIEETVINLIDNITLSGKKSEMHHVLGDDLKIDSIDATILWFDIVDTFKIDLSEKDLDLNMTVQDLVYLIRKHV